MHAGNKRSNKYYGDSTECRMAGITGRIKKKCMRGGGGRGKASGVMSFDVAVHRFLVTPADFCERCRTRIIAAARDVYFENTKYYNGSRTFRYLY